MLQTQIHKLKLEEKKFSMDKNNIIHHADGLVCVYKDTQRVVSVSLRVFSHIIHMLSINTDYFHITSIFNFR